ncbi:SEM4B protein, partial [Amia calva]|nr:SEM4B protein [Amia calva]
MSAALKVLMSTAASIIRKWKKFGTTSTLPRAGRPAKLSNVTDFTLEKHDDGSVKMETGKGKCPFEPSQHYTAVMADEVLYAAATSNFLGTAFDITRATGNEGERIRTETSSTWLSDPEFVSSAFIPEKEPTVDDDKIYFFFTEVAKEYDFYTKIKVPRVARVCKGDVGGMKTLQKRWTTFLKAQLVCEDRQSGQRYNILTDVYTLERTPGDSSTTHFYGLFTSQWEREEVSAVCVYSLEDINKVMAGPYKELKKNCENWQNPDPVPQPRPGQCIGKAMREMGFVSSLMLPDKVLTFVRDHPLMENAVEAQPLLSRSGVTYTRIAVSLVPGHATAAMLYLGTDRGELHQVSVVRNNASLIQQKELFPVTEPVNNILLTKDWVLVGSPGSLVKLPEQQCSVYSSCADCVRAPCGWDPEQNRCVPADPHRPG